MVASNCEGVFKKFDHKRVGDVSQLGADVSLRGVAERDGK